MPVELESALITKLIKGREIKSVINAKVDEKFFFGLENKQAFRYLIDYFRQYAGLPGKDSFLEDNPSFQWNETQEPVAFWIQKLQNRHKKAVLIEHGEKFWEELEAGRTENAYQALREAVQKVNLDIVSSMDGDWTKGALERAKEAKALGNRKGLLGIPTPWDAFDKVLQGWQDQQLITLYARPGTGKSWSMCLFAWIAWKAGYKPLMISKEMSLKEISRRVDAINAKVSHEALRSGTLNKAQLAELFVEASVLKGPRFIISAEETLEGSGLSSVASKIEEYTPDLLLIDGVYLLEDDLEAKNKTESIYNITRGLKRIVKVSRIPAIITAQEARGGFGKAKGLAGIQWSDSFGQDSDVVIRQFQTESMLARRQMGFSLEKQREGRKMADLYTNWDMLHMDFTQVKLTEESEEEIQKELNDESQAP